jgi:hypothetical protein
MVFFSITISGSGILSKKLGVLASSSSCSSFLTFRAANLALGLNIKIFFTINTN